MIARALGALCVVLLAACVGLYVRSVKLSADLVVAKAALQSAVDDAAKRTAESEAAARAAERDIERKRTEIGEKYAKDLQRAKESSDRVVRDLVAGNKRLRDEWLACASGLPAGSRPADEPTGADQGRAELAAAIVRVGAECDARDSAWREWAQSVRSATK